MAGGLRTARGAGWWRRGWEGSPGLRARRPPLAGPWSRPTRAPAPHPARLQPGRVSAPAPSPRRPLPLRAAARAPDAGFPGCRDRTPGSGVGFSPARGPRRVRAAFPPSGRHCAVTVGHQATGGPAPRRLRDERKVRSGPPGRMQSALVGSWVRGPLRPPRPRADWAFPPPLPGSRPRTPCALRPKLDPPTGTRPSPGPARPPAVLGGVGDASSGRPHFGCFLFGQKLPGAAWSLWGPGSEAREWGGGRALTPAFATAQQWLLWALPRPVQE